MKKGTIRELDDGNAMVMGLNEDRYNALKSKFKEYIEFGRIPANRNYPTVAKIIGYSDNREDDYRRIERIFNKFPAKGKTIKTRQELAESKMRIEENRLKMQNMNEQERKAHGKKVMEGKRRAESKHLEELKETGALFATKSELRQLLLNKTGYKGIQRLPLQYLYKCGCNKTEKIIKELVGLKTSNKYGRRQIINDMLMGLAMRKAGVIIAGYNEPSAKMKAKGRALAKSNIGRTRAKAKPARKTTRVKRNPRSKDITIISEESEEELMPRRRKSKYKEVDPFGGF